MVQAGVSNGNIVNGTASSYSRPPQTPIELLQAFLKAQSTRSSISNELSGAFGETNITDNALQRVVEISSAGLIEVRAECEALIASLQAAVLSDGSFTGVLQACEAVEKLEKDRIAEETKRLQLMRIARLNDLVAEEQDGQDESIPPTQCVVEQREKAASVKRAAETASTRVRNLVEQINEHLQEIREVVVDASSQDD